jgi:hypothetical protein
MTLVNKYVAAEILHLSPDSLYMYRKRGQLIEGIHWVKINPKNIGYHKEILENWVKFGTTDPDTHWKFINSFYS